MIAANIQHVQTNRIIVGNRAIQQHHVADSEDHGVMTQNSESSSP